MPLGLCIGLGLWCLMPTIFELYRGGGLSIACVYSCILSFVNLELRVRVIVFNATFNNMSAISWRSVTLMEETGENHRHAASQ